MLGKYDIKEVHGRAYHLQSQGCVENVNETILRALSKYIEDITQKNMKWVHSVRSIIHTKNNTVHESTGFTLFEAFRGFKSPAILLEADRKQATFIVPALEEREKIIIDIQVCQITLYYVLVSLFAMQRVSVPT